MYMRWEELSDLKESTPTIKNHTTTLVGKYLYVFGGYDGRRNHNSIHILDTETSTWLPPPTVRGPIPHGRNGHTATLAENTLYIIGGWLGSGPLAASDMHLLDVTTLTWSEPPQIGTPPGPCNMHTADYVPHLRQIYLFRGGNGREYLNDLHALNIDTITWTPVHTSGCAPVPRANHSSTVVGHKLFIFGGWDGRKRLNDIHILDTDTSTWSLALVRGTLPHPRAGMTFTSVRDHVFLFGGSGPSAKCFNDLQVFNPADLEWVDTAHVTDPETQESADLITLNYQDARYNDGNANPNDNPRSEQIVVLGAGPGRRAGHTSTVVNRKIYVFGGSYGSEYLNDFFILDTDPTPQASVTSTSSTQLLQRSLKKFLFNGEFADITFRVEGQVVHGHRVILSLLSDRFRGMFSSGFREASQREIELQDIRYEIFLNVMEYLYTGNTTLVSRVASFESLAEEDVRDLIELLAAADQFMLDHLKQQVETALQDQVTPVNVDVLLDAAEHSNAYQLKAICMHFIRNSIDSLAVD